MTRLEHLRVEARLTPEQLAEKVREKLDVRLSGMTIRRLESGMPARVTTLWKLADYFAVQPATLLERVEPNGNGDGRAAA